MRVDLIGIRRIAPAWAALALLAVAGVGVVYFVDPRVAGNYPTCPFLYFTGCYCPGCGTLRAIHRLLNGDLRGALDYNPLAVMALAFIAAVGVDGLLRPSRRRLLPDVVISHQVAWGILAVIVLFWALRNVPFHPLTVLAP